jgi:hypothetical protein
MGAVCYGLVRISPSRALNVIAGIPLGALVFYATASALRIPELAEVRTTVLTKLSRNPRVS